MSDRFDVPLDSSASCPNCAGRGMHILYSIDGIPVHSTQRMLTREEALSFPTSKLRLGFCPACGFVCNTAYDPALQHYNTLCEETQQFSPTFSAFATGLAKRWVERYGLRKKKIVEIGCGKADFLMLLCEAGDNQGIGIDPSSQPGRIPERFRSRVTLIQELYQKKHGEIEADCILCRHTLEHIGQTKKFIQGIRDSIGPGKNTLVLFELPDVVRVLKECAFWDIYYEHCSYFSPGSLARLFRSCGFELLELERDYDDQYLLLAARARPADGPTRPSLPLENDMPELRNLVADFHQRIGGEISRWKKLVEDVAARGQKVAVWISLSKGVAFLTTTKVGDAVQYVVDINPHRQGTFMPITGQPIVGPEFLGQHRPDLVVLMNPIYLKEVKKDLDRLGVPAKLVAVGVE